MNLDILMCEELCIMCKKTVKREAYVITYNGKLSSIRSKKARVLLQNNRAKIVNHNPFTIKFTSKNMGVNYV